MAIEIVDFPIENMMNFYSIMLNYQRVFASYSNYYALAVGIGVSHVDADKAAAENLLVWIKLGIFMASWCESSPFNESVYLELSCDLLCCVIYMLRVARWCLAMRAQGSSVNV